MRAQYWGEVIESRGAFYWLLGASARVPRPHTQPMTTPPPHRMGVPRAPCRGAAPRAVRQAPGARQRTAEGAARRLPDQHACAVALMPRRSHHWARLVPHQARASCGGRGDRRRDHGGNGGAGGAGVPGRVLGARVWGPGGGTWAGDVRHCVGERRGAWTLLGMLGPRLMRRGEQAHLQLATDPEHEEFLNISERMMDKLDFLNIQHVALRRHE
ncbi:hypothetical protein BC834DRAFT_906741 [Gloeopeniophorella convolvens]|nr:hypothetical protein BC834DRAFT_906741 [Gloeopeniophorella convolvens]